MNRKIKLAQISKPGGAWEFVERDIPEPGPRQVLVKVEACGIWMHSAKVRFRGGSYNGRLG